MAPREIRPNRRVFIVRSTVRTGAFTFPLVLLAAAIAPVLELGIGLALTLGLMLWVGLVVLRFVQRRIVYGKTRYLLHGDRIVLETGGLVSERSVDLQFTNVTQTTLTLPFLEHRLYETGHVTVQAAGSIAAEIVLESVDEPHEVFESISDALRQNGFSLQREHVIQQERPGLVGSIYELSAPVLTSAIILVFFVPDLLQGALVVAEQESVGELLDSLASGELLIEQATQISVWSIVAGLLLLVGVAVVFFGLMGIAWMDILKRTYTLHDDVIDYTDGFLTKRHNFIPVENLTDVEIEQKLAQRILSISTIKVSCQGAGVDIRLGAVPNGAEFKANLERLIDETGPPISSRSADASRDVDRMAPQPGPHIGAGEPGDVEPVRDEPAERLPPVEGKYDWKRGLAGPFIQAIVFVVLLLLPFAAASVLVPEIGVLGLLGTAAGAAFLAGVVVVSKAVQILFHAYALSYRVDDRKVTHTYNLLNRKETEFTLDKISAVEIRRSPIDRWFETAKVSFTSIGSTEKITFENLENADTVIDTVLTRIGIDAGAVEARHEPRFTPTEQLRALDGWTLFFFLGFWVGVVLFAVLQELVLAAPILVSCLGAIARTVYLKLFCDRASLDVGDRWIRTRTGILIRSETYVPAHHVRGIDTRCNIGREQGAFTVRSGGGAAIGLGYVEDIRALQDLLDGRLHASDAGAPLDTSLVAERAPAVLNAALRLLLFSVITVIFAPLLVVTLPWTIVATRRIGYRLEGSRVVRSSGVFRKRRDTILLARIDHLTTSRGALNRINDTGSIGVVTLGSGGTDMLVRDVHQHQDFYETIEKMTK